MGLYPSFLGADNDCHLTGTSFVQLSPLAFYINRRYKVFVPANFKTSVSHIPKLLIAQLRYLPQSRKLIALFLYLYSDSLVYNWRNEKFYASRHDADCIMQHALLCAGVDPVRALMFFATSSLFGRRTWDFNAHPEPTLQIDWSRI